MYSLTSHFFLNCTYPHTHPSQPLSILHPHFSYSTPSLTRQTPIHSPHSHLPLLLPLTPPTPTHLTPCTPPYCRVVVAQPSLTTSPKRPHWALFRAMMRMRKRKGKSLMSMSCTNGPKASPLRTLTTAVVPQTINCWTLIHLNSLINSVSLLCVCVCV